MNVNRRMVNGELNNNEPHQAQIYISSAGSKNSYAYERMKELMINSVIERAENRKEEFSQKILEKIEKLQNLHLPSVESFLKKFPSIKSAKYREELNMIKEKFHQKIELAKNAKTRKK